jgi:hypothetical protein
MANKFLTNIELKAGLVDVNGNTGTSGQILSSTGSGVDWVSLSEISGVDGTGTANYVAKWSDADTITDSVIYDNGTNVGIGTTSPGARLEVKSAAPDTFFADFISSTGSGSAKIYENSNSHPLLYMADATGTTTVVLNSSGVSYLTSGNIIIGGTADNGDLLQVQGTSYFDGNVGIGTVNPSSKLDISGAVKIDTDGTYGSEYGMVGFGGTTDGYNRIFGRTTTADGLFLASATGRGIFFRANGGNTDHMVVIASGNVGIGTTSPSAKLEVNGDIAVSGNNKVYSEGDTLTLRAGGASGTYLMVDDTVGGVGIGTSPSSELDVNGSVIVSSNLYLGSYVYHNGDINTYFGFPTNDTYAVRTNGSDILYINSSGNVGIGTTSPDRRLHVQDSAIVITKLEGTNQGSLLDLVNSNASQTYNGLRFTQGTTGKMAITHIADGTTKGYVQIGNSWAAGSEILVVDGRTSNVGIGTTSPTAKLTIGGLGIGNIGGLKIEESSSTADGAHFSYNDASRYVVFGGITNNVLNDAIAIERDATRTITIDSLQRVGIGTTSPSYKLDVSGTGRFTSDLTATDYTGNVNGLTSAQYSKFAFKTTGTGASDSGKYTKIARITLTGQYQNTATSLHYVSNGNGSTPISAGKLDIRVKQQAAFGNDPLVDVTNYHNYTSYAKFGYVIVQNTPTTIVDVYVQNTTTYNDITGYITTDDYINTTKITWYTNQSYVTIPGSYVVGNNRLLISANPSGNVSIGNTNDTYKLDVSGTGRFTSDLTVQGTGDSSFAGNVGIGTTSPSEKLEVDGTIKATDYKGYLPAFQHGGFQHTASTSSTTVYWIPTNNNSEVISSQSYNNWVAPYDGRVKKIVMRWASNGTPTATSVIFRKAINGTTDATLYSATVTSPATTDMIVERDFLSTDISFQAGDRVQLGFTTDGGTRLLQGFAYTIVLEYNKI